MINTLLRRLIGVFIRLSIFRISLGPVLACKATNPSPQLPAVKLHRPFNPLAWLKALLAPLAPHAPHTSERQRALNLIAAIDAGGVPLHPARVNHIARSLGLEVSAHAKMGDTVARIRAALAR